MFYNVYEHFDTTIYEPKNQYFFVYWKCKPVINVYKLLYNSYSLLHG